MKKLLSLAVVLTAAIIAHSQSPKVEKNFAVDFGKYEGQQYIGKANGNLLFWGVNSKNECAVSSVNESSGTLNWTKPIFSIKDNFRKEGIWFSGNHIFCLRSVKDEDKSTSKGVLDVFDTDMNKVSGDVVIGEEEMSGEGHWGYEILWNNTILVGIKSNRLEHHNINEMKAWGSKKMSYPSHQIVYHLSSNGNIEKKYDVKINSEKINNFLRYFVDNAGDLYLVNSWMDKSKNQGYELLHVTASGAQNDITPKDQNLVGLDLIQSEDGAVYLLTNYAVDEIKRSLGVSELSKGAISWTSKSDVTSKAIESESHVFDHDHTKKVRCASVKKIGDNILLGGYYYYFYEMMTQNSPGFTYRTAQFPFIISVDAKRQSHSELVFSGLNNAPTHYAILPPAAFFTTKNDLCMWVDESPQIKDLRQIKSKDLKSIRVCGNVSKISKSDAPLTVEGIKDGVSTTYMSQYEPGKTIKVVSGKKSNILILDFN